MIWNVKYAKKIIKATDFGRMIYEFCVDLEARKVIISNFDFDKLAFSEIIHSKYDDTFFMSVCFNK